MFQNQLLNEECGVCGVFTASTMCEAASIAFLAIHALQNRGQEAAGIVTCDGKTVYAHKDLGLVTQVFDDGKLGELKGHIAIGHTRYSTVGSSNLRNAQPYMIETVHGPLAISHNGNLVNSSFLRNKLLKSGIGFHTSTDSELIMHSLVKGSSDFQMNITSFMLEAKGAYALIILTSENLWGLRDPWGLRPLVLGKLRHKGYVLASESCAFSAVGAELIYEVQPGEIVKIDKNGFQILQGVPQQQKSFCNLEQIYFARPDSVQNGKLVYLVRQKLGRQLAAESPAEADIVIPVPESGIPHAMGYSQGSGIKYTEGVIKNKLIDRTFIQPTAQLREKDVAMKFRAMAEVIAGKRIVVVDDSIVRGTTLTSLVKLLRKSGASEVHVRIASPPIKFPCFMGVNISKKSELIASQMNISGIQRFLTADSLSYLSTSGMLSVFQSEDGYCSACFTGIYPFSQMSLADLQEQSNVIEIWGN